MINRQWLDKNISKLTANPLTGEIYIVDLVNIACEQGEKVRTISVPYDNVRGVNTLHDLWGVEQIKRSEFIRYWMSEGVRFELAQSIHIDINVRIGAGSFIGTGAHLLGNTIIGEDCFVGAFSIVENTTIGNSSTIHSHSVIQESHIGCDVHVGPFARLRNNVVLGDNVEIGNFVEIKRSTIGAGSKTKHLTYLGDTTAGKGVNIGAGTITCNYDGKNKFATIIEDEVFIGSNNTLVAPLRIGKGSYTAGGSTITQDVPRGCLALGRSRQENKLDYAQRLLNDNKESDDNAQESEEVKKKLNDGETLAVSFRGALKTRSENKESL
jgi:bifunctional UDP-N-acetylglucosamine pyrophosphorylase/glucosamine-1-phosphate N-acetyltransferase